MHEGVERWHACLCANAYLPACLSACLQLPACSSLQFAAWLPACHQLPPCTTTTFDIRAPSLLLYPSLLPSFARCLHQLLRVEHPAAKYTKVHGGAVEIDADPSKLRFFDRERGEKLPLVACSQPVCLVTSASLP